MSKRKSQKSGVVRDQKRCVIYARFSPRPKKKNADGSDAWVESANFQEAQCREHASRMGMTVDAVFVDEYASGKTMDRPQFELMLNYLWRHPDGASAVVGYDATRIGRTLMGIHQTISTFKELGVRMVTVKEGIDTGTAMGEMIMQIFAMMGEWERLSRSERTRESLAYRQALGGSSAFVGRRRKSDQGVGTPGWREAYIANSYRPGSCLYGWSARRWSYKDVRTGDDFMRKYKIELVPHEQLHREMVLKMFLHEGESTSYIARAMNAAGIRHRNNKEWDQDHVAWIVRSFMIGGTIDDPLVDRPEFAMFITPERAHEITKAALRKSRQISPVSQIVAELRGLSDSDGSGQSRGAWAFDPEDSDAD